MPSDTLVTKLNESNYVNWSLTIEALLVQKDLWDVVNGIET